MIDNPAIICLIGSADDKKGVASKLEVNIIPTDDSGWDDPPEEIIPDSPEDLRNFNRVISSRKKNRFLSQYNQSN
jgi:hypothetical protein